MRCLFAQYNMNCKTKIQKVVSRINSLGIEVNLQSNTYGYYQDEELITARWNGAELDVLCSLLHELGHVIQSESHFSKLRKSFKRDRAIIAEQEYKAWELGWQEAVALNITTPELEVYYNRLWMKCWSGYLSTLYSARTNEQDRVIEYLIDTYASEI